jgi:hypothetical protein
MENDEARSVTADGQAVYRMCPGVAWGRQEQLQLGDDQSRGRSSLDEITGLIDWAEIDRAACPT